MNMNIFKTNKTLATKTIFVAILFAISVFSNGSFVNRAEAQDVPVVDFNAKPSTNNTPFGFFKIVQCDGPRLPTGVARPAGYVECNFSGLMRQVQFLINAMITVGVFAILIGCAIAGSLYISGVPKNIDKAKSIFPKLAWGLIIMITAWFIVYQLLVWLTGNSAYLSGTP